MAEYLVLLQQWYYPEKVTHVIQTQPVAELRNKKIRKEPL